MTTILATHLKIGINCPWWAEYRVMTVKEERQALHGELVMPLL